MRYYLLGKSGLRVSELALGAMSFGTDWGWGTEISEARKMLDLYIDNGGNFVDTANCYTNGPKGCWENFLERSAIKSLFPPSTRSVLTLATLMAAATIVRAWFVRLKQVYKDSRRITLTCSTCTSGMVRHPSRKFCGRWTTSSALANPTLRQTISGGVELHRK
jgi:aldo/keto reductase family protein